MSGIGCKVSAKYLQRPEVYIDIRTDALLLHTTFSNEGKKLIKKRKARDRHGQHSTELLRTGMMSFVLWTSTRMTHPLEYTNPNAELINEIRNRCRSIVRSDNEPRQMELKTATLRTLCGSPTKLCLVMALSMWVSNHLWNIASNSTTSTNVERTKQKSVIQFNSPLIGFYRTRSRAREQLH